MSVMYFLTYLAFHTPLDSPYQLATLDKYVHVHVHFLLKLKICDVAQFLLACIGALCHDGMVFNTI